MKTLIKTIFISILTLVLGGVFGYEVYFISKMESDITEAIEKADKDIGSSVRAKNIEQVRLTYKEEVSIIDEVVLTRADLVAFIERLEKVGRDIGLSISISSITNDSKNVSITNPEIVRVTIEARGSWASNLLFVKLLENLPYKYNIDRLDLLSDGKEWRTNSTLRLTTYPTK